MTPSPVIAPGSGGNSAATAPAAASIAATRWSRHRRWAARPARAASTGPAGSRSRTTAWWNASHAGWVSPSWGTTASTANAPCRRALTVDRSLPAGVRGPVDFTALSRFAAIRRGEAMVRYLGAGAWPHRAYPGRAGRGETGPEEAVGRGRRPGPPVVLRISPARPAGPIATPARRPRRRGRDSRLSPQPRPDRAAGPRPPRPPRPRRRVHNRIWPRPDPTRAGDAAPSRRGGRGHGLRHGGRVRRRHFTMAIHEP